MRNNARRQIHRWSHAKKRQYFLIFAVTAAICNVFWLLYVFHPKFDRYVTEAFEIRNVTFTSSLCPEMRSLHNIDDIEQDMTCQPRPPSKKSCEYTAEHFKILHSNLICKDQDEPSYNLCYLSNTIMDQSNEGKVTCDLSICDIDKYLIIEEINMSNGNMRGQKVEKNKRDSKTFANLVKAALIRARENNVNFIFLNCIRKGKNRTISQMISILPKLQYPKPDEPKPLGGKLNLNVLLLDSISRAHFYRSFPKTIEYLRTKRDNRKPKSASFFEFQLFQGIHTNTHETEKGFFTGELYPMNYTHKQKATETSHPNVLFGIMKNAGYQTMYLEDMCHTWLNGLLSTLHVRGWEPLRKKIDNSNIDTIGITYSSCKIVLSANPGRRHQFRANKHNQLCYNGKHFHQYHLDFLTRYIKAVESRRGSRDLRLVESTPKSKPLFSYTNLRVSHDDVGLRVQTVDQHLLEFIEDMSQKENTLTFVLSDHGNTYTRYQRHNRIIDGRLEISHPFLLGIIPYNVGQILGKEILDNLKINQHRLLNILDLRAGLIELSKYNGEAKLRPAGLLGKISKYRTCNDMKFTRSVICICNGWYLPVKLSAEQIIIAEFALGKLNNMIQDSMTSSRIETKTSNAPHFFFGHCQRLQRRSIINMIRRKSGKGKISETMDILVQSSHLIKQNELFKVSIEYNSDSKESFEIKLLDYKRLSTFGIYEQCADPNVELQLCICNNKSLAQNFTMTSNFDLVRIKKHPIYDIVGKSAEIEVRESCILLIQRFISDANIPRNLRQAIRIYDVANVCDDKTFSVHVNETNSKSISTAKLPITMIIPPRTLYFVTALKSLEVSYKPKIDWIINVVRP
ncbi:uncharacterized protein LOC114532026 [Dendronephthya gigantea]|uniref:uncharacterized protein LOC114532026 n=1 Tax=Dendronephthya gigantea TaxID=151771 RepID=UPI00106A123F|nr:uncharacterized protein LOC114532026 [Dendronephthya gigantea]